MAALVQSYPQQTGTVTLLQNRPNSASAMMSTGQGPPNQSYGPGGTQHRNGAHGLPSGMGGPTGYRGGSAPIQPYAFTSTPSLTPNAQWQQFRSSRTQSTPVVPTAHGLDQTQHGRSRYPASASMTNLPSTASMGLQTTGGSRDDSALPGPGTRRGSSTSRPHSTCLGPSLQPSLAPAAPIRVSPERYRRSAQRQDSSNAVSGQNGYSQVSAPPSGSGMIAVGPLYTGRSISDNKTAIPRNQHQHPSLSKRPNSFVGYLPGTSFDDMSIYRGSQDDLKRQRRRSMPALDYADLPKPLTPLTSKLPEKTTRMEQVAPPRSADKEQKPARTGASNAAIDKTGNKAQGRTGSSDSQVSNRSTGSSSRPSSSPNRNTNVSIPNGNPAQLSSVVEQFGTNDDYRLVNIPPRSSSSDAATSAKRATIPSPLSKPVTMEAEAEKPTAETPGSPTKSPAPARVESAAVRQLAAINEKGGKLKSKTSRLRRAFSFGSTAEFKKVINPEAENGDSAQPTAHSKLHKEPTDDDLSDAEQRRIAQRQEAAGIGSSIYGGKIFSGSTDNISISSTASSASIMIRKMGRGMKKGTRSLVGLFRPKSVIGVPVADAQIPEVSQATVSMVTVEAERERVNVNPDPHTQTGGGTGFPRLERNSLDASKETSERLESSETERTDNFNARKSIIGSDQERAEILAAVRKGILKNTSGSSSPPPRNSDTRAPNFELPTVPHITESPMSSAPSTPNEDSQGHRRTGSVAIGSEDYFMSALRLRQNTNSAPGTPQGASKRNATFSPRIVFHDTWPSQEYDRRGEIATCNRLTPMLAQQIKEELNTFKMEMEVHENSKIYTHFF